MLVFAVALAARLCCLVFADEPIRYTDQYFYLFGGLRIASDPHPLRLIATSDEWRLWGGHWTIAPLYYIFVAGVMAATGWSLFALQAVQCVLGAISAVAVGVLGREAAGPRGLWAGVAYGLYWPAIEMSQRVLTENLHVPLLLWGLALVARAARRHVVEEAAVAGAALGLSALARSVTSSFIPVAAGIVLLPRGERGRWRPALALVAGAAAVMVPWSARNLIGTGTLSPIESLWAFNILRDNAYERLRRYEGDFYFQSKDPAEAARSAPRFIARNFLRNPRGLLDKLEMNFAKVARAEGLHMALEAERPAPAWLLVASLAADDLALFIAFPLLGAFAIGGRPSSGAWRTIVLWTAYYVFMIAVVFHVETRYRSALVPLVLAGAAGGASVLASAERRGRAIVGLLLGALVPAANAASYGPAALRAVAADRAMEGATEALARGDLAGARRRMGEAVARDPTSGRPWITWGTALARAGRPEEAIDAYGRAASARPRNPVPVIVLPQLLHEAGREAEVDAALGEAHDFAARNDNWLVLEEAWRQLRPPRRDRIDVGHDDYGAVRGFFQARGTYRWTWKRAFLRVTPPVPAPAYEVTLVMGSPEPSPLAAPVVTVRPAGGAEARFTLGRASASCSVTARPAAGEPLVVEIDSPTWTRLGESAEQGVIVERMTVRPARE